MSAYVCLVGNLFLEIPVVDTEEDRAFGGSFLPGFLSGSQTPWGGQLEDGKFQKSEISKKHLSTSFL